MYDLAIDSIEQESTFPNHVQQTINLITQKVNTDSTVIDLLSISEFTEEHLKEIRSLYGEVTDEKPFGGWPKVFPELYGDKLPWPIKFNGWKILSNDLVDFITQRYRSGSQTRQIKLQAIHQNIERNGYKVGKDFGLCFCHLGSVLVSFWGSGGALEAILALEAPNIAKKRAAAPFCRSPCPPLGLHYGSILEYFFAVFLGAFLRFLFMMAF